MCVVFLVFVLLCRSALHTCVYVHVNVSEMSAVFGVCGVLLCVLFCLECCCGLALCLLCVLFLLFYDCFAVPGFSIRLLVCSMLCLLIVLHVGGLLMICFLIL